MAWLCSGQGVGLATPEVAGSTPAVPLSANYLGQVVRTRASVTKQYNLVPAVMPCGWEGNRRSDVALAMRHRFQWFIYLRARERKGDEHPTYTPHGVWHTLPFFTCL